MKKKVLALALMTAMLFAMSSPVSAEEKASVVFTEKNQLEYRNTEKDEEGTVNLGNAFEGVAPGETRSQAFTLSNESSQTVDFYMSTEVLQSLEEINRASGAAYDILLTIAGKEIYCSTVGGYASPDSSGSSEGLKEMNDSVLGSSILAATLTKGQTAEVVLQITFDGEAMDNNNISDYSEALGRIRFRFRAGYENSGGDVQEESKETEEEQDETAGKHEGKQVSKAAKTGDAAMPAVGIVAVGAGILLLVVVERKRKTEERS